MSREDLKTHIRDLTHELQLSTYINKGAIQEGQELKARLAELERENAALRTTERRLTETEEKLEECQQMVREKEGQIKRLKDATSGLKNALKEASRQRDDWSRTWEQMRQFMDAKDAAMARSESPDTTGSATGTASTSKHPRTHHGLPRQLPEDRSLRQTVSARPSHEQRSALLSALFAEEEVGGPSKEDRDEGRSQSSRKKKRRIGQESEVEDDPYTPARPMTPVNQSRLRPPSAREKKPVAQPGIVKLETPSPEPVKPEPGSTSRRRRLVARDDGDESDDALGQYSPSS